MNFVSILMENKSDYEIIKHCVNTFEKFDVKFEMIITSANRGHDRTKQYIKEAEDKGSIAFITAAKEAACLAGTVASLTTRPLFACSSSTEKMQTIQMPIGMPVATISQGESGAVNAAYSAMQILALRDKELAVKLKEDRLIQAKQVETDSASIEVIL